MDGRAAIGLDTSVVLRLLIGEPRAQAEVARRRIERALSRLQEFSSAGVVQVDPAGAAEALGQGAKGRAGVVDRLIVARHRALGATTATFDRRLARLEGGVLLRA